MKNELIVEAFKRQNGIKNIKYQYREKKLCTGIFYLPIRFGEFVMSKNNPTKMGKVEGGIVDWKYEAKKLYFNENKNIVDIAKKLNKNRKTISTFLSKQDNFKEEKERRKKENRFKRKEYKENWDKNKRKRNNGYIESALLKRQHEIDVRVLSSEKY